MKYAYLRVSTQDKQEFLRQKFALKDYDIDKYFEEKISGTKKASDREEFHKLLDVLKEGDEVYFESMSRMARSLLDLIDTTNTLREMGVKIVFVKEHMTLIVSDKEDEAVENSTSKFIFNVMGAVAQFERDLISDRTKQALQAKKAQGVKLGRTATYSDEDIETIKDLKKAGKTIREIEAITGISRSTVSRLLA